MGKRTPRYPIYIPSKGRAHVPYTIKMFLRDGVDFKVVVEENDAEAYAKVAGEERLLILPESGRGLVYSRNFIYEHAVATGAERHWQFDDDIKSMRRLYRGYKLKCAANVALVAAEDFVDRYENVAVASFNSWFFLPVTAGTTRIDWPPFYLNSRCYTVFLLSNKMPNRFRGRYNEDTDMSLQVLASGMCTILFNAFLIDTPETMQHSGGQTDIYINDGRLRMARELERRWPGVVDVYRRFGRPQHHVKGLWKKFDTPLKRKPGPLPKGTNEYGLTLTEVAPIQHAGLRKLVR